MREIYPPLKNLSNSYFRSYFIFQNINKNVVAGILHLTVGFLNISIWLNRAEKWIAKY